MRILANACLAAFLSTNLLAQSPTPAPARIQVMVLGTYHFDNPGQDLHNMKVDSVLTPAKQAELADVASRLAVASAIERSPDPSTRRIPFPPPPALALTSSG